MSLLAIDLGGTKLATAVFTPAGTIVYKETIPLNKKHGYEVGALIAQQIQKALQQQSVDSIGISVPGISNSLTNKVWAPNIAGWDDYPLLEEVQQICGDIAVIIESDRACYILGEVWQGAAKGCKDAIYLSVGTGIGAGILVNGKVLHGASGIAGAVGWMALIPPYKNEYISCGCFEHYASGEGIVKVAKKWLQDDEQYTGELRHIENVTARDIFAAYEKNDLIATKLIQHCIELWGMAIANLVSIFNPEKIILGGGVFGPATAFIEAIKTEAARWAQPVSMKQMSLEASALGGDAGIYGAAFLALQNSNTLNHMPYV